MKYILNETQYKSLNKILLEMNLKAYGLDWDDNILHMPTKIKMDKRGDNDEWVPTEVTTEEFAQVRNDPQYRIRDNNIDKAFSNFREYQAFLDDTELAIHHESFAPSFWDFKKSLMKAEHFAINTARGHEPRALKDGVKVFIEMVLDKEELGLMLSNIKDLNRSLESKNEESLIDWYLENMGEYYPVSSEEFAERFGLSTADAANPEESKKIALKHFVDKVFRNAGKLVDSKKYTKFSFGFSDDDIGNVKAVEEYMENELNHLYPDIQFVVYDTSGRGKREIVIEKK